MTALDIIIILAVIALFASFTGKSIKKIENEQKGENTPGVPLDDFVD